MDLPMYFELCMRGIFGNEAHQIAGTYSSERNKWLIKSLNFLLKNIDRLDITECKKEVVVSIIDQIKKRIPKCKDRNVAPWELVFEILILCSSAFGVNQLMDDKRSKKNVISARKHVIAQLKGEGYTDHQVGIILNISEYQVRKIKSST